MSTNQSRITSIVLAGDGGPGEGGDDIVDVTTHISNNFNVLANLAGVVRFTTAAGKPTSNNYSGKVAQEIDTTNVFIYDGAQWQIMPGCVFVCTSATRPDTLGYTLQPGQEIFETNTKACGVYTGTAWRIFDTEWQVEVNAAKFTHAGAGGMTGNLCTVRYFRSGKKIDVKWEASTQAGTNYGVHGNILLGMPTGYTADSTVTGSPGIFRGTVGNVWHHGEICHPTGDGSQVYAVFCKNDGTAEQNVASNGSIAGNWILALGSFILA